MGVAVYEWRGEQQTVGLDHPVALVRLDRGAELGDHTLLGAQAHALPIEQRPGDREAHGPGCSSASAGRTYWRSSSSLTPV